MTGANDVLLETGRAESRADAKTRRQIGARMREHMDLLTNLVRQAVPIASPTSMEPCPKVFATVLVCEQGLPWHRQTSQYPPQDIAGT